MTAPARHAAAPVLELDDIQGTLLRRRPDDYHGIYLLHLSFPEIAAELFVSRNTVKSQVLSIYRKLGVSSRSKAVDRARDLGLLEG